MRSKEKYNGYNNRHITIKTTEHVATLGRTRITYLLSSTSPSSSVATTACQAYTCVTNSLYVLHIIKINNLMRFLSLPIYISRSSVASKCEFKFDFIILYEIPIFSGDIIRIFPVESPFLIVALVNLASDPQRRRQATYLRVPRYRCVLSCSQLQWIVRRDWDSILFSTTTIIIKGSLATTRTGLRHPGLHLLAVRFKYICKEQINYIELSYCRTGG